MTNSIKISPQRTSFILSVSVILYWATDSYLYLNCHIDMMEYSTPVILYITAMILACGVLKHFFFRFITKNELSLSFDKQVKPFHIERTEQIKEIESTYSEGRKINLEKPVVENCVKHDYMNNYEMRAAEIEREKAERQADIKRVIHEYTTFVMTANSQKQTGTDIRSEDAGPAALSSGQGIGLTRPRHSACENATHVHRLFRKRGYRGGIRIRVRRDYRRGFGRRRAISVSAA